jgi:hypothetical protein
MAGPLRIDYELPRAGSLASLEVAAQWQHAVGFRSRFTVPRLMNCFAALGESGGYAGARELPERSNLTLLDERKGANGAAWRFAADFVDPGTLGVLTNVLAFSHRHVQPLARVLVRTRLLLDSGVPAALRGCASVLPFQAEVAADALDVYVELQLSARPLPNASGRIESLLASWQNLAAAGAFEDGEEVPTKPLAIMESGPSTVQDLVFCRLEEAVFDEAAFDALLNALRGFHMTHAPLRSVDVS